MGHAYKYGHNISPYNTHIAMHMVMFIIMGKHMANLQRCSNLNMQYLPYGQCHIERMIATENTFYLSSWIFYYFTSLKKCYIIKELNLKKILQQPLVWYDNNKSDVFAAHDEWLFANLTLMTMAINHEGGGTQGYQGYISICLLQLGAVQNYHHLPLW